MAVRAACISLALELGAARRLGAFLGAAFLERPEYALRVDAIFLSSCVRLAGARAGALYVLRLTGLLLGA